MNSATLRSPSAWVSSAGSSAGCASIAVARRIAAPSTRSLSSCAPSARNAASASARSASAPASCSRIAAATHHTSRWCSSAGNSVWLNRLVSRNPRRRPSAAISASAASATCASALAVSRASRLAAPASSGAADGKRIGEQILPRPRDQFAHQIGIAQHAARDQPVEHRLALAQPARAVVVARRRQRSRRVAPQIALDRRDDRRQRSGQCRARPVVEPGIVGHEEIVDRLRQSAIGATQRSRRAREQLTGAPASAVVNVASVDRHGNAIADASLNCG